MKLTQVSGHFTNVSEKSWFWQKAEEYLRSGQGYKVTFLSDCQVVCEKQKSSENCLMGVARRVSYLSIIGPLVASLIRSHYRKKYTVLKNETASRTLPIFAKNAETPRLTSSDNFPSSSVSPTRVMLQALRSRSNIDMAFINVGFMIKDEETEGAKKNERDLKAAVRTFEIEGQILHEMNSGQFQIFSGVLIYMLQLIYEEPPLWLTNQEIIERAWPRKSADDILSSLSEELQAYKNKLKKALALNAPKPTCDWNQFLEKFDFAFLNLVEKDKFFMKTSNRFMKILKLDFPDFDITDPSKSIYTFIFRKKSRDFLLGLLEAESNS